MAMSDAARKLTASRGDEEHPCYGSQESKDPPDTTQKEGEATGIFHWYICRCIASFQVSFLTPHYHAVLAICQSMAVLGVLLSITAFWGAFSGPGMGLKTYPWMEFTQGETAGMAGVRMLCTKAEVQGDSIPWPSGKSFEDSGMHCRSWVDMTCEKAFDSVSCGMCRAQSTATVVPVLIATVTYVFFTFNTHKRFAGKDSNKVKVICCAGALIGGLNFAGTLAAYSGSCITNSEQIKGLRSEFGHGLKLVIVATVLKLLAGVLHLCLPVQRVDGSVPFRRSSSMGSSSMSRTASLRCDSNP